MEVGCGFYVGVTAALIDRTNNPQWSPATLEQASAGVGGWYPSRGQQAEDLIVAGYTKPAIVHCER